MGESGQNFVVEVTAITHRTNPIYQAFISQMPPSESSCIRRLGRSMSVYRHLSRTLGLPVTDVLVSEASGSGPFVLIAMRKAYDGHPAQAMHGVWSYEASFAKFTIVVDDDVNIHDPAAVEWAMGWTVQPERDIHIQRGTVPLGLDPSQPRAGLGNPPRQVSSKVGIDATRKGSYPARSVPPDESTSSASAAPGLTTASVVRRARRRRARRGNGGGEREPSALPSLEEQLAAPAPNSHQGTPPLSGEGRGRGGLT